MKKKCTVCEEEKDKYDFCVRRSSSDGRNHICRLCVKKKRPNWKVDNRGSVVRKKKEELQSKIKELIPLLLNKKISIQGIAAKVSCTKTTAFKHIEEIQNKKYLGENFETMFSKFEEGTVSILDISIVTGKDKNFVSREISKVFELRKKIKKEEEEAIEIHEIKPIDKVTIEEFKAMQRNNYYVNHDPTIADWNSLSEVERRAY